MSKIVMILESIICSSSSLKDLLKIIHENTNKILLIRVYIYFEKF